MQPALLHFHSDRLRQPMHDLSLPLFFLLVGFIGLHGIISLEVVSVLRQALEDGSSVGKGLAFLVFV